MPSAAGTARALAVAAADRGLVRVSRAIRRSDKLDGYVLDVGSRWVLLAVLDPAIVLDGYTAVRLADVTKVEPQGQGKQSFVARALELRGDWPPAPVEVALDGVADVLRTAGALWPLVTIHIESTDPTVCYIGRPIGFTTRSVELLEIDPEASWDERPTKWPLAAVTRIDFGGRYEDALASIGGPAPTRPT